MDIENKLKEKCSQIEFGTVSVVVTVHNGKIAKIEYITTEKEIVNE